MSARLRTLVIALLLGAISSAIGVLLYSLRLDTLPQFNRTGDLVAHGTALDYTNYLGIKPRDYDETPNDKLGVINIDDYTLQSGVLGPWPFPRTAYATLLKKLKAAGARVVAFDVDFPEAREGDAAFAQAMREMPTVLAYSINTARGGNIGEEPPVPVLQQAATATGYSTVDTPGGYLLGQPPEIVTSGAGLHTNEHLLSLSAASAQVFLGHPIDFSRLPRLNGLMLLVPPEMSTLQNMTTHTEDLTPKFVGRGTLHFSDVYQESVEDLKPFANGALIYVGSTAQGLFDFITTARGRVPGLFINARLADQFMRGYYMTAAPDSFNIILIIALPLLAALSFTLLRPSLAILISVVGIVLYAYVNLFIFITKLVWFDLLHVGLAMLLATMSVAIYRVLQEAAQRRMVTNLFGMHVSPAIVKDILANDDPKSALALTGKKVRATIFYSDIRGFTAMSETMTPEEIYTQLNEYFEEMCAIIFEYGGYVDKFIGDCVMAVFSAPYQTPDDPKNAIIAAVRQQEKIRELSDKWKAMGKREFTVGMGLNTGDVVMGNLGASSRMNYTVIGDNVNLAARLYNVALAGEIIISDYTYQEVKDIVVAEEREPVMVKGKKDPIKIYNVTAIKEGATVTAIATAAAPEPSPA